MIEEWKVIEGYEDYQISNLGRVKLKRGISYGYLSKAGYCIVMLSNSDNKKDRKRFFVHRLVAFAFVENKNNLPIINHLDENKTNNIFTNLEWTTTGDNSRYSLKGKKRDMSFLTDEMRKKWSETHKGKVAWNKGLTNVYSEETLRKIGEASKRRIITDETRKKMSESKKGKKISNTINYKLASQKRDRDDKGRFE